MFLIGGMDFNNVISSRVFEGKLTENQQDVIWQELDSMIMARFRHVAFKMNNSVYVVGGLVVHYEDPTYCERYDLIEHKWYDSPHFLPYPLCYASVVVSEDETFAVITGGKKETHPSNEIIIFTEEHGFRTSNKFLLRTKRFHHVSIKLS